MLDKIITHFRAATIVLFLLCGSAVFAAKVDTLDTYSNSMQKHIKAVVITPQKYSRKSKYPVVYLLHGYSGNYSDWVKKVPAIKNYADQYDMIIVCADGNYNSWYIDSPMKQNSKYDTYISSELISIIDAKYNTIATKQGRAITGLSMGGHGALYLALKHQDVYGYAGSMSGGVDLKPFEKNWELKEYISASSYTTDSSVYSVVDMVPLFNADSPKIIFECGTEDFFYNANVQLHEKLEMAKISHIFISSPGSHNWDFWANAIQYQLLFFNNQFKK